MHGRKVIGPVSLAHDRPEICGLMARFEARPSEYFDGDEYAEDHWIETELSIEHSVEGIPIFFWKWS